MPSIIARRVQRSRKWVRDASAWTASSSSDQLTDASVSDVGDERLRPAVSDPVQMLARRHAEQGR